MPRRRIWTHISLFLSLPPARFGPIDRCRSFADSFTRRDASQGTTVLYGIEMIIPLTLPSGPSAQANTLPPALAQLSSSELFLIELQGDLILTGDKRGQLVGQLTIDDNGKVRAVLLHHDVLLLRAVSVVGEANAADRIPPARRDDREPCEAARGAAARAHSTARRGHRHDA